MQSRRYTTKTDKHDQKLDGMTRSQRNKYLQGRYRLTPKLVVQMFLALIVAVLVVPATLATIFLTGGLMLLPGMLILMLGVWPLAKVFKKFFLGSLAKGQKKDIKSDLEDGEEVNKTNA